jgi:hypothetical protein
MKFTDLARGSAVFVDANTFAYAFAPDPQFGPPCGEMLERVEHRDIPISISWPGSSDSNLSSVSVPSG